MGDARRAISSPAKRLCKQRGSELFEESGAKKFDLIPICDYCVKRNEGAASGVVFAARIARLAQLPGKQNRRGVHV